MQSLIRLLTSFIILLVLIQSCATKTKTSVNPSSSKFVYSLMAKDNVGLNAIFSKNLQKTMKGKILINALLSLQKENGEMKAIELVESSAGTDSFVIKMKSGEVPLRVHYSKNNKVDEIWLDNKVLK